MADAEAAMLPIAEMSRDYYDGYYYACALESTPLVEPSSEETSRGQRSFMASGSRTNGSPYSWADLPDAKAS